MCQLAVGEVLQASTLANEPKTQQTLGSGAGFFFLFTLISVAPNTEEQWH